MNIVKSPSFWIAVVALLISLRALWTAEIRAWWSRRARHGDLLRAHLETCRDEFEKIAANPGFYDVTAPVWNALRRIEDVLPSVKDTQLASDLNQLRDCVNAYPRVDKKDRAFGEERKRIALDAESAAKRALNRISILEVKA